MSVVEVRADVTYAQRCVGFFNPRRTLGESDGLDDRRHKPRVGVSC
jgi:hypothetical protein